jgi:hypothetical protein
MESTALEDKRVCPKCLNEITRDGSGRENFRNGVCRKCYDSQRYVAHPEISRIYTRKYYLSHKAELNIQRVQRYHNNQEKENAVVAASRRRNGSTSRRCRIALIELLGGKCVNCDYDKDVRALYVDHVNGGGRKERLGFKYLLAFYRYYLNSPEIAREKLQVLCANCNAIKRDDEREYWFGGSFHTRNVTTQADTLTSSSSPE